MKKIVLSLLLTSTLLYGCGFNDKKEVEEVEVKDEGEKEDTVNYICTYNIGGIVDVYADITASSNVVTNLSFENTVNFENTPVDITTLEPLAQEFSRLSEEHDGLEYSYEVTESEFFENIDMDLKVADLSFLLENGFIDTTTPNATYIGLEETLSTLETLEADCEKK